MHYMLEHPKALPTDNVKLAVDSITEMGNQQERLDAARLAMLFDTDGWVTIRVLQRAKNRYANLVPLVAAVSTTPVIIDWAAEACTRLGVARHIAHISPSKYEYCKGNLDQRRLTVQGHKRVVKILPLVIPFLLAKRRQAELLLEFVNSRLAAGHHATYTERELEIANMIRGLNSNKGGNFRPVSSETVRATRELTRKLRGMIQADPIGNIGNVTEQETITSVA